MEVKIEVYVGNVKTMEAKTDYTDRITGIVQHLLVAMVSADSISPDFKIVIRPAKRGEKKHGA